MSKYCLAEIYDTKGDEDDARMNHVSPMLSFCCLYIRSPTDHSELNHWLFVSLTVFKPRILSRYYPEFLC